MHIVFDLQTVSVPSIAGASDPGDYCLFLAHAAAQHAAPQGHRVTWLLPGTDPDTVVRIRRQLDDLPHGNVQLQIWHPTPRGTPWHRQVRAVMYRQLLGRLGADAVVFISDLSGAGGHPLAGTEPDWLPAGCRGVLLVDGEATVRSLPGATEQWTQALRDRRIALCAPATVVEGAEGRGMPKILPLPASNDRGTERMAQAAQALCDLLRRLDPVDATQAVEGPPRRPRLAYVSPLPPARTGIADYSADLVHALAAHYDIDLIVDVSEEDAALGTAGSPHGGILRSVEWFTRHGDEFDRVLYHFGNSPFHRHMPALCERFPGTVVLHDFFLGDLLFARDFTEHRGRWQQAYYRSHGYGALRDALQDDKLHAVLARYPVNFEFLRHSRGVIVHSERACELAAQWLPSAITGRFRRIPLLRIPVPAGDREGRRQAARRTLDAASGRFMICCFGMVGKAKANLEILQAWLRMDAAAGGGTELVFVGANEEGEYGRQLLDALAAAGEAASHARITGWVDADEYRQYLEAADAAVQLRTIDRGETSAAVLDCMNHGLPTIVNDSGSMAELPPGTVSKVPAEFSVEDIAEALNRLHRDPDSRAAMAEASTELLHRRHAPDACAAAYRDVLENDFYRHAVGTWQAAVPQLVSLPGTRAQDRESLAVVSNAVAATLPPLQSARQLLVDVTAICRNDLRTGIQRVVRALLMELIESPPPGYRIEPVYLCDRVGAWHLRYARKYTLGLIDMHPQDVALEDGIVESRAGDVLLGLDFSSSYIVETARLHLFDALRRNGVSMHFVVYDLLPVLRPEMFPQEAGATHERWLHAILGLSDSVVCISHAVASELRRWMEQHIPDSQARIEAFHLGANMDASVPTRGLPEDANKVLAILSSRPTLLTVGTVEPRKGIAQALAALELLWQRGIDVNLVLVGKAGWHVDALIEKLKSHPQLGHRLFWLAGISDEYLEAVYGAATCLLAASEAEGFGLPLIEAAQKGLPIIARDIPVFREIAGKHAFFFSGDSALKLADAISQWLTLDRRGEAPQSDGMAWLSWQQSAQALMEKILGNTSCK
jgi:glycosyltransferase involved in cell wall biosynthesis